MKQNNQSPEWDERIVTLVMSHEVKYSLDFVCCRISVECIANLPFPHPFVYYMLRTKITQEWPFLWPRCILPLAMGYGT